MPVNQSEITSILETKIEFKDTNLVRSLFYERGYNVSSFKLGLRIEL